MQTWFGRSWGAPCCDPGEHGPTPVGELCAHCEEPIEATDSGVLMLYWPEGRRAQHQECNERMVGGSVGHVLGMCSCYVGGQGWEDPPWMTRRQAAIVAQAIRITMRQHGIDLGLPARAPSRVRQCKTCGMPFDSAAYQQKYCSDKCRQTAQKRRYRAKRARSSPPPASDSPPPGAPPSG